jgi:hypothetical protein
MPEVIFKNKKTTRPPSQLFKNLGVVLFNVFASFFNWFVIVVCLIILIVGYWWLIKPKYDFIASNQELTFREREYETKVSYLKQLNEIKSLYRSITPGDKDKVSTILSINQDLDRLKIILLREISQVGKEQQIPIDNIVITPLDSSRDNLIKLVSPSKEAALMNKLHIIKISFTLQEINYDQIKKVLLRLESSLRLMDITSINFNPVARNAGLELFAYYLEK